MELDFDSPEDNDDGDSKSEFHHFFDKDPPMVRVGCRGQDENGNLINQKCFNPQYDNTANTNIELPLWYFENPYPIKGNFCKDTSACAISYTS